MSATVDRFTGKPATAYTLPEDVIPCPACTGRSRETVGMVCQTCGTDYGTSEPDVEDLAADLFLSTERGSLAEYRVIARAVIASDWLTAYVAAQQADLIAAITALRDRARDPKHGGRVTVHEITALLPEEHR